MLGPDRSVRKEIEFSCRQKKKKIIYQGKKWVVQAVTKESSRWQHGATGPVRMNQASEDEPGGGSEADACRQGGGLGWRNGGW